LRPAAGVADRGGARSVRRGEDDREAAGDYPGLLRERARDHEVKFKMQNSKCKIGGLVILHFAFCILNSAAAAAAANFDQKTLHQIDAIIDAQIAAARLPGGVIWIE